MTTIAYKDGMMAGDSLVTSSGMRIGQTTKVHKIRGYLVGICGTLRPAHEAYQWLRSALKADAPPPVLPDFGNNEDSDGTMSILLVTPDGEIYRYDNKGMAYDLDTPMAAIGSGAHLALAAMKAGASAKRAVDIAVELDVYSGGPVKMLRF